MKMIDGPDSQNYFGKFLFVAGILSGDFDKENGKF